MSHLLIREMIDFEWMYVYMRIECIRVAFVSNISVFFALILVDNEQISNENARIWIEVTTGGLVGGVVVLSSSLGITRTTNSSSYNRSKSLVSNTMFLPLLHLLDCNAIDDNNINRRIWPLSFNSYMWPFSLFVPLDHYRIIDDDTIK